MRCRSGSGAGGVAVEFRILGPLQVIVDGRELPLGRKLLRALLAVLLLNAREVRTTDQLIDDLWQERAPANARTCLHNLVSTLRGTVGRDLLETRGGGYVLVVAATQVDASRFERLLARSRREPSAEKVRLLESALALWRGSPLVDVRYEEFAQADIRRLEELRVCALEELLGSKLELGLCETLVPELQRLVDANPFRERLRMLLMVALHRTGRSVDALTTYATWRRTVTEVWGIEPGRAIRQLWDEIRGEAPRPSGAAQSNARWAERSGHVPRSRRPASCRGGHRRGTRRHRGGAARESRHSLSCDRDRPDSSGGGGCRPPLELTHAPRGASAVGTKL